MATASLGVTWCRLYCQSSGDDGTGAGIGGSVGEGDTAAPTYEHNPDKLEGEEYINEYCRRAGYTERTAKYVVTMQAGLTEMFAKAEELGCHPFDVPPESLNTKIKNISEDEYNEINAEIEEKAGPPMNLPPPDMDGWNLPPLPSE